MSYIDYSELIKSKKNVISSERRDCGNIIGERGDSIIVEREGLREHVYVIPKSKVDAYDGAQIILKVTEAELKSFEEKEIQLVAQEILFPIQKTTLKALLVK